MSFKVEKSELTTLENDLFLKGYGIHEGYCHIHENVKKLLSSDIFRKKNKDLVPIFQKADKMMNEGLTGEV